MWKAHDGDDYVEQNESSLYFQAKSHRQNQERHTTQIL
jgi:hypothetical protein